MITIRPDELLGVLTKRMANDYRKIHQTLFETVQWGEQKAVELTNKYNKVDEQGFKQGWKAKKTQKGAELRNNSKYAAVIEYGRKPGRTAPPVKDIADWMKNKGIPGSPVLMAQAIGKHGSPPNGKPVRILHETTKMIENKLPADIRKNLSVKTFADVK